MRWKLGSAFTRRMTELEDIMFMFTCAHPGDSANFEESNRTTRNFVVRQYDDGLLLAKAMWKGGELPGVEFPPTPNMQTCVE